MIMKCKIWFEKFYTIKEKRVDEVTLIKICAKPSSLQKIYEMVANSGFKGLLATDDRN